MHLHCQSVQSNLQNDGEFVVACSYLEMLAEPNCNENAKMDKLALNYTRRINHDTPTNSVDACRYLETLAAPSCNANANMDKL